MSKPNLELISPEQSQYLQRIQKEKTAVFLTQVGLVLLFFLLWELLARWHLVDPFITSQPSRILKTVVRLYLEGQLFQHIGITCLETIIGFLLGTLLGTCCAVLLWWSKFLTRVAEPYLVVLNSLPKIALAPIFIIWIGAGPAAIVVMALAISLIVTVLEVLNGLLAVDKDLIKLVKTFGATRFQTLIKVVLPSAVPSIVNALKVNVGLSWVGVIVGEFLVSKAGLGYLIVYGGQVFQLDLVMTNVLILSIAAALMYQGVIFLEQFLLNRHRTEQPRQTA